MSCFLHYLHSSRNYLQFIAVRVIVANLVANHVIEQKLVNFVSEKVIYVNRFESTIFGLWTLLAYNFEGLGMRKWNIPTNRAHKIVERNGVICLLTMFTSGVMVIKISQMTHFLYFLLLMTAKSQRVWANGFWSTIKQDVNPRKCRFRYCCQLKQYISTLTTVSHEW